MASGIASSASGFAALTVAASAALGSNWMPPNSLPSPDKRVVRPAAACSEALSNGSGAGEKGEMKRREEREKGSHFSALTPHFSILAAWPHQMHDEDHWALRDVIAIVSAGAKRVSSSSGHRLAATSPFNAARTQCVSELLATVRRAIAERDFSLRGPVLESDALAMHAVMMTSAPSLLYWQPGTLEGCMRCGLGARRRGVPVYFTIDAGPNVI